MFKLEHKNHGSAAQDFGSVRHPAPLDRKFIHPSHYLQDFTHARWCRLSSINIYSIKSLSARADLFSLYHRYRAVLPETSLSGNTRGCGPNVVLVGLYL